MKSTCSLILAIVLIPTCAFAQSNDTEPSARAASRCFVRIGVLDAIYHPSAEIATSGLVIPGATATVSNNMTLMFDIGYDITKAFSLQITGGIPPKPMVTGERAVASLGDLGAVRYGPVVLTGVYHMPRWRGWQPYVGAGTVYAIILHEEDRAVSDLNAVNNWGFVLQGGIERALSNNFDVFVDFKEAWLAVGAHGNLLGQVPVTAKVILDPSIIGIGMKVRFR
jgi:outer membrane protein